MNYIIFFITIIFSLNCFSNTSILTKCSPDDAVCVGEVLLQKLDQIDTQKGTFSLPVKFFESSDCSDKYLMEVDYTNKKKANIEQCNFKSRFVDVFIRSVSINGHCRTYDFKKFLDICLTFK